MENRSFYEDKIKSTLVIGLLSVLAAFLLHDLQHREGHHLNADTLQNFSAIFVSIVLEAMPFILLGALISALIQVFVSEQLIAKVIPQNKILGIVAAAFMGLVFPVCECAVIPIAKRLMKKGVPSSIAVTFMLAVPIVNPIVLASTYYAFHDIPVIVILRGGLGVCAAATIGFLVSLTEKSSLAILKVNGMENENEYICGCGYQHVYRRQPSNLIRIIEHTSIEVLDIGKYLIIGALLSAAFQTLINRGEITAIGLHPFYSVLMMMLLAYVMSICSEADAFIARTFVGQFTTGSILAFLILGPMIDIKNTLMLMGNFKARFALKLIFYIALICFAAGCFINGTGFFGGV